MELHREDKQRWEKICWGECGNDVHELREEGTGREWKGTT